VIDAADGRQLDTALAQLAGGLTGPLNALRDQLLDLLADLEAGFDFTEEDIRLVGHDELAARLASAADAVARLSDQMRNREQTDAAPRVVLVGAPNAGKSSLFNALVGISGALVSPTPGTTRDYVRARLELDGLACELIDTAGLDAELASDGAANAAQRMTREQAERADLQLQCIDSSCDAKGRIAAHPGLPFSPGRPLGPAAQPLVVFTKCDLSAARSRVEDGIATSSVTQVGLDELKAAIRDRLVATTAESSPATVVAGTANRCRESLRLAADALAKTRELAAEHSGEELIAAELRGALVELGKIVGAIYTDDLLDRIFSRFCIGK
jgi:tRNA modification GTPase